MKNLNLAGMKKIGIEAREKAKKAAESHWARVRPAFQKYGDKLLFVLGLAVLVMILFSAGGEKAIAAVAAPSVVFTQWRQDDFEKETLRNLVQEFENLHGGIKIVLKDAAYEDVRSELFDSELLNPAGSEKTKASPGDILALDPLWVPELVKRGIIENEQGEKPRTSGLESSLLSFIDVLYYNVGMLKDSGFTRPPKTRGEFLSYARAVAAAEKNRAGSAPGSVFGLALGGSSSRGIYDDVYPWIWAAGAQLIREGKPAVNSRPVVECLAFLASLNSEGLVIPGALSAGAEEKLEDFTAGRAAFMIAPAGDIEFVKEHMGDGAFGISSVPQPDNYAGKTFYGTAGWTVGIYSGSAHKEEAELFAAFLAEKTALLSEQTKAAPGATTPAAPDPLYSKVWDIAIAGESARDFSGLPGEYQLEGIFREELSALFAGEASPAEAAAAIQEKWNTVLAK